MIFTMEHFTHPLALPTVLLSIPLEGSNNFWKLWDMYNLQDGLGGIYWPAVWQQGPKLAGLFVVVCFGSCMDMAAIQQEMPLPLDFNSELVTVASKAQPLRTHLSTVDWLVLSYKKLSGPEMTFSAIMAAGLMEGIAAGVVAATLYFAYKYAQ
ncbi:putative sulfate transporter, partial [Haematococcus lacustris]